MDSTQSLKLSNIRNLHNSIDTTSRTGIEQKGELVKDLNSKKQYLINSIQEELRTCKNAERSVYNGWQNMYNTDVYNRLEEFNVYLKGQHDRGSELIANINAAKNFQQLNEVEMTMVNPFLESLRTHCGTFTRALPTSQPIYPAYPQPIYHQPMYPVYPQPMYPEHVASTEVETTGMGRTDIDVHHTGVGTDVNVSKEESFGSPAHSVHISGAKGPVRVSHSPQQIRNVSYVPPVVAPVRSVAPILTTPVRQVVPVTPVQPVHVVSPVVQRVVPVTPVQPVQRVVPVTPVQPVQRVVPVTPVRPVQRVVPVQPVVPVTPVQPVRVVSPMVQRVVPVQSAVSTPVLDPVGARAVVTHDYVPRIQDGSKLSLRAGTYVTIHRYHGDWALVTTTGGQRGYVSRHYLRML